MARIIKLSLIEKAIKDCKLDKKEILLILGKGRRLPVGKRIKTYFNDKEFF